MHDGDNRPGNNVGAFRGGVLLSVQSAGIPPTDPILDPNVPLRDEMKRNERGARLALSR